MAQFWHPTPGKAAASMTGNAPTALPLHNLSASLQRILQTAGWNSIPGLIIDRPLTSAGAARHSEYLLRRAGDL